MKPLEEDNMPLRGLEQAEIIDLAVRAEKAQRRRQWKVGFLIAGLIAAILLLLSFYLVYELHQLNDAQLAEIEQLEVANQQRAEDQAELLDEIEKELVPRAEFATLEAELARANAQLREQKAQLAAQERLLKQQSRQLAAIQSAVGRIAARRG
jgi:septal ring factor EnvC (AmiA/AmiB activator)